MTPNVPKERVDTLRKAFDLTVKDPDFLADAAKARREIDPIPGVELQRTVNEMVNAPKDVVDRLVAILAPPAQR
jgi:hypothetical protein